MRAFRAKVRAHYRRHGRSMPWRETRDPYRILVSEVMLQQTQVDRVRAEVRGVPRAFPDVAALAAAPLERVLAAWQGLGYNRRALALHRGARIVVREHGGPGPGRPAALVALPGIGAATAASIRAFAFDAPVVFIETNIRRVFIHEFFPGRDGGRRRRAAPARRGARSTGDPRASGTMPSWTTGPRWRAGAQPEPQKPHLHAPGALRGLRPAAARRDPAGARRRRPR